MGYIAIVDYGVGNLKSVSNALSYLGLSSRVTDEAGEIEMADSVILPGVGAFPDAFERLKRSGLDRILVDQAQRKPILGICLGMQLLFSEGWEVRRCDGLGLIPGKVDRIRTQYKLPHIGWNSLLLQGESPLFAGVEQNSSVYFVHSFCGLADDPAHVIAQTEYGPAVTAAVQNGCVFGTQFHPEKSGEVGLQILKNFGVMCR